MNNLKAKASKAIIPQVPVNRLDTIISENNHTIIDVRDPKSIEKQGSIPGAINIPFDTVERAIDSKHGDYNSIFNSEGPFLFCCTGGVMSYMAAIKAQERGVRNVYNLEGGHSAWLKLKEAQTV